MSQPRARHRGATRLIASLAVAAVGLVATVPAATAVPTSDVGLIARAATSTKVTLTIKGGAGKALLLLSKTGQTLALRSITQTPADITLTVPKSKAATLTGASLHLVHSAAAKAAQRGEYFGPVVLGWKGASRTQAARVYTRLKATTSATIALGTVQVATPSATQGYAYAVSSQPEADAGVSSQVRASAGKPCGVGTYGLSKACTAVQAPGRLGRVDPPTPDLTLGGDRDDDGIPNAFDVNDDGDAKIDSADGTTPTPVAVPEGSSGALCTPVEFRIFTNLKATQPRFAGVINFYGSGDFEATPSASADTIENTMSMVFSRIPSVCGSNVVKTELKGVGVAYAPADYVELGDACMTGDFQWLMGRGRMCSVDGAGYDFGSPFDFTAASLPSGQDTFMMRVTTADGKQFEFTSSAGFVFVTHPMLVAFGSNPDDLTTVDYSTTTEGPDGTALATDPSISVTETDTMYFQIYRPQRLRIDGEVSDSEYVDLGGYRYSFDVPNLPGVRCDAQTVTDSTMSTDTPTVASSADAPTLLLQMNLGECVSDSGQSWTTGAGDVDIMVQPQGPGGNSALKIRLTRE